MITKTKILIGISIIVILIIGGWWTWNQQKSGVTSYCRATNPLYCENDNDCICIEDAGCFLGNKNYYEKCADKTGLCMDFCTGWGQPPVKCINNQCTNSYEIEDKVTAPPIIGKGVILATDKTEYALGEKAKVIIRNNSEKPIWYVDYICPLAWQLEFRLNGNFKSIENFSPETLRYCKEEEKFCRKGYITEYNYCPSKKPIQELVEKLEPNSEIYKIWTLRNRKYQNGILVEDITPGNYRLSFAYGLTKDTYAENFIYSNEFGVKKGLWRKISDVCREGKEFIEEIRSDPECLKGEGFRCVDGWGGTSYYDKRLVSASTIEAATNWRIDALPSFMPDEAEKELSNATIAIYSQSSCACEKPIGYKILIKDKLEEVTCEEFYQFLQNYESSCGDCILMWSYGCC